MEILIKDILKRCVCNLLVSIQADTCFRYLNRKKILVVMYHGVTKDDYLLPVWTQLPAATFRKQIKFLKANYRILSLSNLLHYLSDPAKMPERCALITFDDGLENNYSVAFPILKEFSAPATIFLTTNFIGSNKLLWFDELFLLFQQAFSQNITLENIKGIQNSQNNLWQDYFCTVEELKVMHETQRALIIDQLKLLIDIKNAKHLCDFKLLNWSQVEKMKKSGLIDFGVHTANHNIVSTLPLNEWQNEMYTPKKTLENRLNSEIISFCFPNGRPKIDFGEKHVTFLKASGYKLAFTTKAALYCPNQSDHLQISRKPAGNDFTSYMSFFKLNMAGFFEYFKKGNL